MAVITYTIDIPRDRTGSGVNGAYTVTWPGLANGDTGQPFVMPHYADRCVQVRGTFGVGGSVTIEGSNDQPFDANGNAQTITYATLHDPQGANLTFTAGGLKEIMENANAVRPSVTAGDGTTNLTVALCISTSARSA